jgi:diadenosine tetraphosphate (Ap4A) HIT family hydrolase
MNSCKFCSLLASGPLASQLPNWLTETPRAVVVVNRRPLASGHLTIILKTHLDRTGAMDDRTWTGVGDLLGRLSSALERRHRPARVVLLGDGKRSAHVHLHLVPEAAGHEISAGDAVADLNAATRTPTMSDAELAAAIAQLQGELHAPSAAVPVAGAPASASR